MSLSPDQLRLQRAARKTRAETAEALDVSEAHAAAHSLSPSLANFFGSLTIEPLTRAGAPLTASVNVETTKNEWRDDQNAETLLLELELYELVEETPEGNLVLTDLGYEALTYLFES